MYNFIAKTKYFYLFSGTLVVLSILSLFLWGLKYGLEFTGGTAMEVKFNQETLPPNDEIQELLKSAEVHGAVVQPTADKSIILRYAASSDDINDSVRSKLQEKYPEIEVLPPDYVGSSISSEFKKNAVSAITFALLGIALYVAYAFRKVSRPVASWKYGVGAIIALAHDVLITVGVFSVLGKFMGVEIDTPFIAALLTILGFSVHDTIVVYDRTRENLTKASSKENFEETVNRSLNETMARSITTSLTVIITLLAILVFGGESIRYFTLALLIGISFGTYSSIFIASALMVTWWKWERGR